MAPHLTAQELDHMREMLGKRKTPTEIHTWLVKTRSRKGILAPNLTNVRKTLKGNTYKSGTAETRGVKRTLSRKQILKLDGIRKRLLKKKDSEEKVTWPLILRVGRLAMKVTERTVKI
jgi:hypothetical protein